MSSASNDFNGTGKIKNNIVEFCSDGGSGGLIWFSQNIFNIIMYSHPGLINVTAMSRHGTTGIGKRDLNFKSLFAIHSFEI
jgi:hypothetical protein